MTVAFFFAPATLGVGLMGSAMAHRLLDQGIAVIAWDRESDHVRTPEGRGGEPAKAPELP
jgi:3-hydroxyisobutyrate dehydrogenase-like beta-hydroxyacid dehydrogenase